MAPTWPSAGGSTNASSAAKTASTRRGQSGHSARLIVHTACATIATATIFSPRTAPDDASAPCCAMPSAKAIIAIADGSVKPAQAASAPRQPARSQPSAMPVWLLAGPGRNWVSATRSAKARSSSQWRRSTNSLRK